MSCRRFRFCDAGADYFEFILSPSAVGNMIVLLALLVFAGLNASRALLVDATCRVLWKRLFAGHFEFLANCDHGGTATAGSLPNMASTS